MLDIHVFSLNDYFVKFQSFGLNLSETLSIVWCCVVLWGVVALSDLVPEAPRAASGYKPGLAREAGQRASYHIWTYLWLQLKKPEPAGVPLRSPAHCST